MSTFDTNGYGEARIEALPVRAADPKQYRVPAANYNHLVKVIEKANRKIRTWRARNTLDLPEITCEIISQDTTKVTDSDGLDKYILYYNIEIVGEGPVPEFCSHWILVATLDHTTDPTMVRVAPYWEAEVPVLYRTQHQCDYCHTSRSRKETFLLYNKETGEYKQIGRNCLSFFFPAQDVQSIADWYQTYFDTLDSCSTISETDEEFGGRDHGTYGFSMERYLEYCSMAIRKVGYITRRQAELNYTCSTSDMATTMLTDKGSGKLSPTTEDTERAKDGLSWIRDYLKDKDPAQMSTFDYNMWVIVQQEWVLYKHLGLAAYILPYMDRVRSAQEASENSDYFGEVGARGNFELKLVGQFNTYSRYGAVCYKLMDRNSNVAIWYSATQPDMEMHKFYNVTAMVKDHKEYTDHRTSMTTKQTIITRLREGGCS